MFTKMNPSTIVLAHFCTLKDYGTNKVSKAELFFHFVVPAIFVVIHFKFGSKLSEGIISILVSAASIFAGLMLNLLVLIYTLIFNSKQNADKISNYQDFLLLSKETLATISYSVLVCIILVLFCFLCLSEIDCLSMLGRIGCVYFGISAVFCLLMVLKRCYSIIQYELQ